MSSLRVLIVDDSAPVRRMLKDILSKEEGIEVVDAVADGESALERLETLAPDVITLDVEMPGMDGLTTLAEIRKKHGRLPVIMFSALTERAAATTLEALARGATDYVTKPSGTGSREASVAHVQSQLVPKIFALGPRLTRVRNFPAIKDKPVAPRLVERGSAVEVVAIGSSTGGPNALSTLFADLPRDFPVPVVLTQHMPPVFTRMLAERLSTTCAMTFKEAEPGETLLAGHVYVAPGDFHLKVARVGMLVKAVVEKGAQVNSCRPSVDVMFQSVADVYGATALGIVLTGMGQDGMVGAKALRDKGANVVVQDEESSVVWGMPGAVAKANLASAVLPLKEIAADVLRRVVRLSAIRTKVAPT